LLTTEIFTRAAFVLVHPFRTSFKVTPKDGIDDGGWSAARQLRLVLVMAGILAAAVVARVLALLGLVALPALGTLAVVAGISFAVWELVVVAAALWRVTRRHQVRRHYRVPVEVAGVVGGMLVRVVDLTPGGAGMIGPQPFEVGAEVDLRLDLPTVAGAIQVVRVVFTVCSSRPIKGLGWRMGGTLVPAGDGDGEALIEHCHVVSSRSRLTDAGRLVPGGPPPGLGGREEVGPEEASRRQAAAGA
jgi:hypothetical protein